MRTLVVLFPVAVALAAAGAVPAGFDHGVWEAVLKRHVNATGEVDYGALKRDRARFDAYVQTLAEASPDSHQDRFGSRNAELAYWLNAYNALVTRGIVDIYPIPSVRAAGPLFGFFRRADHTLGGRRLSLNTLEHQIIRKRYGDARIHFAIVCASVSCPLLAREAFTGASLEEQLDRLTRASLAQARMVTIDTVAQTLRLSSLFKWYAGDFGNIPAFLRRYLSAARAAELDRLGASPRIRYFDYDWSINDPGSRARARQPQERELAGLTR